MPQRNLPRLICCILRPYFVHFIFPNNPVWLENSPPRADAQSYLKRSADILCDVKLESATNIFCPIRVGCFLGAAWRQEHIFALTFRYPKWCNLGFSYHIHSPNVPAAQAFADAARLSSSDVSWKRDAPPAADAEEHAGKTPVIAESLRLVVFDFLGVRTQPVCPCNTCLCGPRISSWRGSTMATVKFHQCLGEIHDTIDYNWLQLINILLQFISKFLAMSVSVHVPRQMYCSICSQENVIACCGFIISQLSSIRALGEEHWFVSIPGHKKCPDLTWMKYMCSAINPIYHSGIGNPMPACSSHAGFWCWLHDMDFSFSWQ